MKLNGFAPVPTLTSLGLKRVRFNVGRKETVGTELLSNFEGMCGIGRTTILSIFGVAKIEG